MNGVIAHKPSRLVEPGDAVVLVEPRRYVGRGGLKLAGALDRFDVDPSEMRCLDVGASTGGFTDLLLQRHADHVVALDVGHAQLHERIRADARVTVLERTNMRQVGPEDLGPGFDLVVVDVSFISLCTLMPALAEQLVATGSMVALVKPQFEVAREEAARGNGVVTDPALWRRSVLGVVASATAHGLSLVDATPSPLRGGDGNAEFFVRFVPVGALSAGDSVDSAARIDDAIVEVQAVVPHGLL